VTLDSSVPGPTWAIDSSSIPGHERSDWMPGTVQDILAVTFGRTRKTRSTSGSMEERSWRIYYGDIPQTFVCLIKRCRRTSCDTWNLRVAQAAHEERFPLCSLSLILLQNSTDDNPPHNTMQAKCLIRMYTTNQEQRENSGLNAAGEFTMTRWLLRPWSSRLHRAL